MRERTRTCLYQIINAFIIAGVIILLIGIYYSIIKAGIPYQDPPLDLKIQYEVNAGIGRILTGIGFKITIYSSVIHFVLNLIWKKCQKK